MNQEHSEESSNIEVSSGHGIVPLWLILVMAGLVIWGVIYLYLYWWDSIFVFLSLINFCESF